MSSTIETKTSYTTIATQISRSSSQTITTIIKIIYSTTIFTTTNSIQFITQTYTTSSSDSPRQIICYSYKSCIITSSKIGITYRTTRTIHKHSRCPIYLCNCKSCNTTPCTSDWSRYCTSSRCYGEVEGWTRWGV